MEDNPNNATTEEWGEIQPEDRNGNEAFDF